MIDLLTLTREQYDQINKLLGVLGDPIDDEHTTEIIQCLEVVLRWYSARQIEFRRESNAVTYRER